MKLFISAVSLIILCMFASGASAQAANKTYQSGDLLVLHWDAFPDYDDLQAMIATRELLDDFNNVKVLAVIGTTGNFAKSVNVLNGSLEHMSTMFTNVIDARRKNWTNTAALAANQWEATLQTGATVHVAEGGPSEFTARVINVLKNRGIDGLKRIRVVQHSASANEKTTAKTSLNTVKSSTTYINIDDGNTVNGTSGFNGKIASAAQRNSFKARSLASEYGSQWSRAYSYVNPQSSPRVIDFSDFVAVMNIMGVSKNSIPTIAAFADRFFSNGQVTNTPTSPPPVVGTTPSAPTSPTTPAPAGRVATSGDSLAAAKAAYKVATAQAPVDCDPVGGGRYVCANFRNPTLADVDGTGPSSNSAPPNVTTKPPAPTPDSSPTNGKVAVAGNSLVHALSLYSAATNLPRVDCDSVGNGQWVCANFKNPTLADVSGSNPAPVTPGSGKVAVLGINPSAARAKFASVSSSKVVDCDPVGNGQWVCANFNNPMLSDVTN